MGHALSVLIGSDKILYHYVVLTNSRASVDALMCGWHGRNIT